jgi:hypothetical protein
MAPLKVFAFDYATAGGPMSRRLAAVAQAPGRHAAAGLAGRPARAAGRRADDDGARAGRSPGAAGVQRALRGLHGGRRCRVAAGERVGRAAGTPVARYPARQPDPAGQRARRGAGGGQQTDGGARAGRRRVPVAATYSPHAVLPDLAGAWVVKPDDGAGCFNIRLFSDRAAALAWIRAAAAEGYVLQPFIAGKLGSLSLLCCDGVARVLSCNLERVAMRNNRFHFLGSTVNGLDDHDGALDSPGPAGGGGHSQPVGLCRRRLRPHRQWRRGTRRQSAPHRRLCRPARLDRPQPGRDGHRTAEGAKPPCPGRERATGGQRGPGRRR